MNYNFEFDELRSSVKEGKRYARVRAIANGADSFNSVFTRSARESLIEQLKSNGVKTNALHKNAIDKNLRTFLKQEMKNASGHKLETVQSLLGNLVNREYPIGKVVDAGFADDTTIEVLIEENTNLKNMGAEEAQFLDAAWNMIEEGTLGGVSVVFNDVEAFQQDGKTFIDKLNLLGLDFVDRPSHTQTRVLETFMRAAAEAVEVPEEESEDEGVEMRMAEEPKVEIKPQIVDVDEVVAKAEAKIEAKQQEKEEAAAKEAEAQKKFEEEKSALEEEKAKIEAEKNEAIEIAKEAVEKANIQVVESDNPHADKIAQNAEGSNGNPLEGKPLGELFKLKAELSK